MARYDVALLLATAGTSAAGHALLRMLDGLGERSESLAVVLLGDGPLAEDLRRLGVAVRVVESPDQIAAERRRRAVRSPLAGVSGALRTSSVTVPLVRALAEIDPDVVCSLSPQAHLQAVPAARLLRRPLVWCVGEPVDHAHLPRRSVRLLRALARRVPFAVVAASEEVATTLPGARRLRVISPGIAPEEVWRAAAAARRPGR